MDPRSICRDPSACCVVQVFLTRSHGLSCCVFHKADQSSPSHCSPRRRTFRLFFSNSDNCFQPDAVCACLALLRTSCSWTTVLTVREGYPPFSLRLQVFIAPLVGTLRGTWAQAGPHGRTFEVVECWTADFRSHQICSKHKFMAGPIGVREQNGRTETGRNEDTTSSAAAHEQRSSSKVDRRMPGRIALRSPS